mgnify:CR=1 FL=1
MRDNKLDLWDKVKATDPKQTKKAKIGQMNITAICPQFQRKNATALFGSYGIGWGILPDSEQVIYRIIGDTELASYSATMFYNYGGKSGAFPICSSIKLAYMTSGGSGYLKIDDEYMKKLQTDALTNGLSFLGFNSDVFEGLFDDNRYVAEMNKQFAEQIAPEPIRQESVDWAVNQYKEIIMADTEEVDFLKMQAIDRRLSNDERIAVSKGLGDEKMTANGVPNSGRLFRRLVADFLKMKPEDLLNKDDFFVANLLPGDK